MSETLIFLTKNDFITLAHHILKTYKAIFVPAVNCAKPEADNLKSSEEIERHFNEYPHEKAPALTYHIISPSWAVEPLYFSSAENKFVGSHYSVIQRYGGPSIHFTPHIYGLPTSFKRKIVSGIIGDYAYYISGSFLKDRINGYKTIRRPESLENALIDIKKFIKKYGVKVVYRNSIIKVGYAMTEASQLYDNGVKLTQGDLSFEKE